MSTLTDLYASLRDEERKSMNDETLLAEYARIAEEIARRRLK